MFNYYILLLQKTTHTLTIRPTGHIFIMIKRFETRGFNLVAVKFVQVSVEHLVSYCAGLTKKLIFPVWEGLNGVKTVRVALGETDPADSKPGTIRGDFAVHVGRNFCHGSDAVESANHGIGLWFKPEKLVAWESAQKDWLASCENIR